MNWAYSQSSFNLSKDVGFPSNQFYDLLINNDTIIGYGLGFNNDIEWRQGLVLTKFDTVGNVLLSKIILHPPGDFYSIDKAWGKIIKTSDGGYAMTSAPFYSNSALLIKTDAAFNVTFIKEYPDTVNLSNYFYKILETPEGYLLYGNVQGPDYYGDGFIRYVDKMGETIWLKNITYSLYDNNVLDIYPLNDSVYVAGIGTETDQNTDTGIASLLYFNLDGEELNYWASELEPEIGYFRKFVAVSEDAIISFGLYRTEIIGSTNIVQPALSKLTSNFDTAWVRHFGRVSSLIASVMLWDFAPTPDGHYIGAGETLVKDGSDPTRRVGWLYKFSADGDSLWERKINAPFLPLYYTNSGFFAGVGVLSSGSIIAGGSANEGNTQYCWLVKVTPDGCLDTLFCNTSSVESSVPVNDPGWRIFPNPANDLLRLEYPAGSPGGYARLSDIQGRLRRELQLPAAGGLAEIPVSDLPQGIYIMQWYHNGHVGFSKVLIAH